MLVCSVLLKIFRINLKTHLRVKLYTCWFKIVVLNLFWGLLTPLRSSWKQQFLFQEIYTYKHKSCTWFQLFYGSLKSIHELQVQHRRLQHTLVVPEGTHIIRMESSVTHCDVTVCTSALNAFELVSSSLVSMLPEGSCRIFTLEHN